MYKFVLFVMIGILFLFVILVIKFFVNCLNLYVENVLLGFKILIK